jgi:hypothetical protein
MRKRPAGTVPCGSFGGPLTKSVHVITDDGNRQLMKEVVGSIETGYGQGRNGESAVR